MQRNRQLSLSDIYEECKGIFEDEKPKFLALLESLIDFADFIPQAFYCAFYQRFGRNREYSLDAFVSALILQKILAVPTDCLLIIILKMSRELRDFCGFTKVPDASKFTRFKQGFLPFLTDMFNKLVDYTEPICRGIDKALADMLTYDTSGIEAHVTENNPKYINSLIKKLKSAYADNPNVDPYKMAYGIMPSHASADETVKQLYINGHFCYVHKFGIVTNGLGIVRHISFLDDDFKVKHPELVIPKKSDSPDEDKSIGDSTSLQPVLNDFFSLHPNMKYGTFLGDSAFDAGYHYTFLKDTCNFNRVLIPLNIRNSGDLTPVGYNEYGYPLCPNDKNLTLKYCGVTREKGRTDRIKWICPKVSFVKGKHVCSCDKPCSSAVKGRTAYTYDNQDFRMLPGIARDSTEWNELYKIRCVTERTINHFKSNMCVANRKSRDLFTTKADLLLASIAQLFTVILADKLNQPRLFRSLKSLVA